jgi:hypothetical protein
MSAIEAVYDKRGIPIERGDVVRVFHFTGARRKRHYMYKHCLGPGTYPSGKQRYVFFSHLNFQDDHGKSDGPYHEHLGTVLPGYEIVQSIKCDHEDRPRALIAKEGR